MTATGDVQAAVDAGIALARPNVLDPDLRYAMALPEGGVVHIIQRPADDQLKTPRRYSGTTKVYDAASFEYLWKKYSTAESELYADPKRFTVTAVLNADTGIEHGVADWRDHLVLLTGRSTAAWNAWAALDGKLMGQVEFAEFVEDRLSDFASPPSAQMLEIAQSFQAATKVDFESAVVLSSSQRKLVFKETVTARAGQRGEIDIPATFDVALIPFEGGEPYRVGARLRYRIREGVLAIGYKLDRPDLVLETAFGDVRAAVAAGTGAPVLLGESAGPR